MLKLMLGIPAYRGQVHYGHVMQMMSMAATVFSAKGHLSLRGFLAPESCSVDWSRNQIVHTSLKDGSDWVLMCDADTFHSDAKAAITMIAAGIERSAAVVASPVRIRRANGKNYNVLKAGESGMAFVDPADWKGKVIEVDRIGTAFMAVNLDWIRKRWPAQPWFVTQHLEGPAPSKIGEDISFCDGVRARGGLILADGRFEPVHVGATPTEGS